MFGQSRRSRFQKSKVTPQQRNKLSRIFETLEDRRMLANFAVTTTADRLLDTAVVTLAHRAGADGKLSLREAIYLSNINPGPDTVTLKANSTYKITVAGGDEDGDATGDFDVLDNLTINGKGNNSVVNGNGLDRVFNIPTGYDNVSLTFNYVVVTGGVARSSNLGGGRGGGVFSNSEGNTLTLNHSSVVNNISTSPNGGTGGGIWWFSGDINVIDSHVDRNSAAAGTLGFGGGMHLDQNGTITIKRSTVNGNTALEYGGGITSSANNALIISDSQLNNNHSGDTGGGAVAGSWRLVSITNSTLNGNTTTGVGGAVNLFDSAQLTIAKSKLTGNSAVGDGGAVFASEPLSVIVTGSTFKDNNSTSGARRRNCGHQFDPSDRQRVRS